MAWEIVFADLNSKRYFLTKIQEIEIWKISQNLLEIFYRNFCQKICIEHLTSLEKILNGVFIEIFEIFYFWSSEVYFWLFVKWKSSGCNFLYAASVFVFFCATRNRVCEIQKFWFSLVCVTHDCVCACVCVSLCVCVCVCVCRRALGTTSN